jgi:Uma2 family endonuclease
MATIEGPKAVPLDPPPRGPRRRRSGRYRWTAEQFLWLDRAGLFEDARVELLGGEIHEMTSHPPHATATGLASEALRVAFGQGHIVRQQQPLDLGRRSLPEPDVAVVIGSARNYSHSHPRTAILVVEVSDTTLRKDRTIKVHLYARAGIPDYWILNLADRQLELFRNPGPDPDRKGRFHYAETAIVPADGHASPLARPGARIAVADLLP